MGINLDELKKRYKEMSIEKLALIEESYHEGDYSPEAIKVIKETLEERKQELEKYRKQDVIEPPLNDDESVRKAIGIPIGKTILFALIIGLILKVLVQIIFGSDLGFGILIYFLIGLAFTYIIYRIKLSKKMNK